MFIPMHNLDLKPNGHHTLSIAVLWSGEASVHLSGLKHSTSEPKVGRWRCMTQGMQPTTVPPGMYSPQMTAPSGGTTRSIRKPVGGWRRKVSLMQASRYGRLEATSQEAIVSLLVKALSNSSRSLARTLGFCLTWKKRQHIAVRLWSLSTQSVPFGVKITYTASGFGTTIMRARSTISFREMTPSSVLIAATYVSRMSSCLGSCLCCAISSSIRW
jgi:hypothetical protein